MSVRNPSGHWIQQKMIEASPFGMVLVDAQQTDMPIIYVNAAFEQLTGYNREEVLGKNGRFLQRGDRKQPALEIIRESIANATGCQVILRNYRKDGTMYWNELRISPVYNDDGVVTHYIGIQDDITARKEAEIALQKSEIRYRQMFDKNRAIKLVINPETGQIKDANEAAVDFYGYDLETLQSMTIQDINMLSPQEVYDEMQRAKSQERTFFEFQHRLASGEIRDVDVFSSPVDMPDGRYLYSIILDVTEQRKSAQMYRALFEQSNDAVFILNFDGKHVLVNQRASEMFGYSVDELTQISYHKLVEPDQIEDSDNVLQRLINGETILPYERVFRHKDGHLIFGEINVEMVYDGAGNQLHIQSIVRDITAAKHMREQEMALSLEQERVRILKHFIEKTSHEFRTPLTIINSSTYLMAHADSAEKQVAHANKIEKQVEHLTHLVDMLLKMVALETVHPQLTSVDIMAIINRLQLHVCNLQKLHIAFDIQPDLPPITANKSYLEDALYQILNNACRFTDDGGDILFHVYTQNDCLIFEIQDTGMGIAEADLPHVFETFWRKDNAHTTAGLGLGLPTARKIIEIHQGDISIESDLGRGTTVVVRLPLIADEFC